MSEKKENENVRLSGYVTEQVYDEYKKIQDELKELFPSSRVSMGMALTEVIRRLKKNEKEC